LGWKDPPEWIWMRTNTDLLIGKGTGSIGPYVGAPGVFRCPADRSGILKNSERPPYRVRSYAMNSAMGIGDTVDRDRIVTFYKSADFRRMSPSERLSSEMGSSRMGPPRCVPPTCGPRWSSCPNM
jgi:hypothetical protein